jgi:hypothetical protein
MSESLLYILEPASDTRPYTHSTRLCMKAIHDGMGAERALIKPVRFMRWEIDITPISKSTSWAARRAPPLPHYRVPGTATRLRGVLCPTLCVTDFPVKTAHPLARSRSVASAVEKQRSTGYVLEMKALCPLELKYRGGAAQRARGIARPRHPRPLAPWPNPRAGLYAALAGLLVAEKA